MGDNAEEDRLQEGGAQAGAAEITLASLPDGLKWQVSVDKVGCWVELPKLERAGGTMCKAKELGLFFKFPGRCLVRADAVRRWNSLAHSLSGEWLQDDGHPGMVLSAPPGFGKSIEAYFFACLALKCGWVVEYTGLASEWIRGAVPNECARRYLKMIIGLNGDRMKHPLGDTNKFTVDGNRYEFGPSKAEGFCTLFDLVKFGADNKEVAAEVHFAVVDELGLWEHTPVLRIVDEHNELWKDLGPDPTKWDPYFQMFTKFQAGRRLVTVYLGSQHNVFEVKITAAYQKFIQYVQPFSEKEFEAMKALPAVPKVLHDHFPEIVALTNRVPRDVTLIVEIADKLESFGEVVAEYRRKRFSKMKEVLMEYNKEMAGSPIANKELQEFLTSLRDTLLPSRDGDSVPASFMDRSLVYRRNDFCIRPINAFARELLVAALFSARQEVLQHKDISEAAFLSQNFDNSIRGGLFEELHLRQLWLHPSEAWVVKDEYGDVIDGKSQQVFMQPKDLVTLAPSEHLPTHPCTVPTLYRGYQRYPRWDFVYADPMKKTYTFMQTSVSFFRAHDRDSAEISIAFKVEDDKWGGGKNQIEGWLDQLTGTDGHKAHCTVGATGMVLTVNDSSGQSVDVNFLYVTTSWPRKRMGHTPKYASLAFAFLDNLPVPLRNIAEEATHLRGLLPPSKLSEPKMTVQKLKALCDTKGIQYDGRAKRQDLIDLLNGEP
eukprot:m.385575 g.385575  ORF g.385575 m.385575 type:complete len:714 (-) comp16740_c0_seq2:206-2347(-)